MLNGLKAASPLLPVVNCQTCVVDDGTTIDIIFNVLKHTCLIIFSIDFFIQPPDLNEVFWLVYNILIPHCFCQKVSRRIMPEIYNTKSLFEGLRGQLCCGFAGGLQLSIKVLTHTGYSIYSSKLLDCMCTTL